MIPFRGHTLKNCYYTQIPCDPHPRRGGGGGEEGEKERRGGRRGEGGGEEGRRGGEGREGGGRDLPAPTAISYGGGGGIEG